MDRKVIDLTSENIRVGAICQKVMKFPFFRKMKSYKKSLLHFCIRVRRICLFWEVQNAKVRKVALFALRRSQIVQVALFHTCTTFLPVLGGPKSLFSLLERFLRKVGPPGAGPLTGGDPPGGRGGRGVSSHLPLTLSLYL